MTDEKSDKWAMPEPIFRRSTGELVRPGASMPIDPEPDTLQPESSPQPEAEPPDYPLSRLYAPLGPESADQPQTPPATVAAGIEIEPQPSVPDVLTAEKIVVDPPKPAKRRSVGPIIFAVGAVILLGAAAGLILLVYFFFFNGRSSSGGF